MWLVLAAVGGAAYLTTLVFLLPMSQLGSLITQTATLPDIPFLDTGTAAVIGLLVSGLAAGALGKPTWWRATSAIVAGGTVAYLLLFQLPMAWVVVGWCVIASALVAVSERVVRDRAVRIAAEVVGLLAVLLFLTVVLPPTSALVADPSGAHVPLLHDTTAAGLAIVGLLALGAYVRRTVASEWPWARRPAPRPSTWFRRSWSTRSSGSRVDSLSEVDLWYAGQVALSVCWAFLGLGILVAGLLTRHLPVRLFGLALLGLATVKVFIVDMSTLDIAFRVLSFMGLGLLLLGTGWIYLRLQARAAGQPDQPAP